MRKPVTSRDLEELLHKLHATARVTSQPRYSYQPWEYTASASYDMTKRMKVEETVEMTLPLDKLKEVADTLLDIEDLQKYYGPDILHMGQMIMVYRMAQKKEERIRNNNPAVQKAWEKYQTLMNIVKDDNDY